MGRQIESVQPTSDARWVDHEDDRNDLGPIVLTEIHYEPVSKYGPRWVATAGTVATGERVRIALAGSPIRDAMFARVRDELEQSGADTYEPMVLYKRKREKGEKGNDYWTFRSATADELAAAVETAANVAPDSEPEPENRSRSRARG